MCKTSIVAAALLITAPLHAQEAKDPNPPTASVGTPTNATGGPDGFGYTFIDTNEASGCTFNFIDISATGTFVVDGDDTAGVTTLSAPFSFYGSAVTQLAMASNGYLSTDPTDTGPDLSNDCPLPVAPSTGGGARMYPLHDDLNLQSGIGAGVVEYFPSCPRTNDRCGIEDCTIFQWDNVSHFGNNAETFDVQAILYHQTNDVVYQYGPGNPETGSGSTQGVQNAAASIGLTHSCNVAASIPDNFGVCIVHPSAAPPQCAPVIINPLEVPTTNWTGLMLLGAALCAAGVWLLRR